MEEDKDNDNKIAELIQWVFVLFFALLVSICIILALALTGGSNGRSIEVSISGSGNAAMELLLKGYFEREGIRAAFLKEVPVQVKLDEDSVSVNGKEGAILTTDQVELIYNMIAEEINKARQEE